MNPISSALSTPVQSTLQTGTTAPANTAPAPQTTASQGDTATISEQGKALSKAASDKDGDEAAAPVKTDTDKATAARAGKTATAAAFQAAKIKQKQIQKKFDDAKMQAKLHPNTAGGTGALNARLLDANRTVKVDMVKVYS